MVNDLELGDDWGTFSSAALRLITGQPLYVIMPGEHAYGNLPHVIFLFFPLAILPHILGYLLVVLLSLGAVLAVCRKWQLDFLKVILIIFSAPMIATIYHGNLDALVLITVLLPRSCQALLVLCKPQDTIGLLPRSLKYKQTWVMLLVIGVLAVLFNYQVALQYARTEFIEATHNLWRSIAPRQYVLGGILCILGLVRRDNRLLLLSSPLLSPYATLSNLLGSEIALMALLNRWLALISWALSWLALAYR